MDPLIARLGLALAIGLLVGLERGWRERDAPDGARTAGIRTYAITGLLGGLFAALAKSVAAPSVLIAGLLAFTAVFAWYKSREAIQDADFSVTGVVAALGVFVLGALAVAGITAPLPPEAPHLPSSSPVAICCMVFSGASPGSSCAPRWCWR